MEFTDQCTAGQCDTGQYCGDTSGSFTNKADETTKCDYVSCQGTYTYIILCFQKH